ncbi:MAG TPA: endo-1,4-beta-xylanase [Chitinophagaceae bacterium]|nr:endo-1,4-beta-xylanase [Chitinophagaceae bacterium]
MIKKITAVLGPLLLIFLLQCTSSKQSTKQLADINTDQNKGLKDYYKEYFPMGAAVSPQGLLREEESKLILQQFNSITAENAMKMGPIHPRENEYFWKDADSIASFAKRNNLKLRGHTLCWHNQTPRWLFIDSTNNPPDTVSKALLLQRLKEHITAVVTRYKDVVYAWDVVNEVISDNPNEFYRNSTWYRICGEEFITKAFEYAHAADPKALLFYNDYNETDPVKREKIYKMVKGLKDAGVPIHGVGLQAHWSIHDLREGQVDSTIGRFASLGLKVQITELDIKVQPAGNAARLDSTIGYTAAREMKQTEQYEMVFRLFRKYKNVLSGVTFWNVSDRYSWLDRRERSKAYPLLFDTTYKPKKAYWKVVNFDKNERFINNSDKRPF